MHAVGPAAIVERQVTGDAFLGRAHAVVRMQVNLFVFHRLPQPFDEHVVAPAALAVHADGDAFPVEYADEGRAGKLTALIGVEDLGRAVLGFGFLDRFDAEIRVHGDRDPMRQNPARRPVDDRRQVDESA